MKKLLGTLLAIIIGLVVAHYSGMLTRFAIFEGQRALYTEEQLAKDLSKSLPRTIGMLKEHFPDDYEEMIDGLLASVKQGGDAETVRLRGSEIVANIRRQYAASIAKAPDAMLKSLVSLNIQLLEQVEASEGVMVCGAVAVNGAKALPLGSVSQYFPILDEIGAATFLAIHSGRTSPVDHGQASDEDWATIVSALQTEGMSEDDLGLIGNLQSSDQRYCGLIIKFLKAVEAFDGPAGVRVRAVFAAEIGAA